MRRYHYHTHVSLTRAICSTLALTLTLILLAACGVSPAAGDTSPTASMIRATATPQIPTSLTILRFGGPSDQNHVAPFQRTIQNATSVQHLYRAVYTLPSSANAIGCPIDLFIGYELTFMRGTTPVLEVLLSGGCPTAKLVNSSDCRAWKSDFTAQIAATLGVSAATLEPPEGLVNTANPGGPFAPFGPTPSVRMPIRC